MAQTWKCSKCGTKNLRRKRQCPCGKLRPPSEAAYREPAHRAVLKTMKYEEWVERFGEQCGVCGAPPKDRKLNRDHDHKTGLARGLLCVRCNRALPSWMNPEWLRAAADYLDPQR